MNTRMLSKNILGFFFLLIVWRKVSRNQSGWRKRGSLDWTDQSESRTREEEVSRGVAWRRRGHVMVGKNFGNAKEEREEYKQEKRRENERKENERRNPNNERERKCRQKTRSNERVKTQFDGSTFHKRPNSLLYFSIRVEGILNINTIFEITFCAIPNFVRHGIQNTMYYFTLGLFQLARPPLHWDTSSRPGRGKTL